MNINRKALLPFMVALIVLSVSGAIVYAQESQPEADLGDCVFYTADGYVDNETGDATQDDAGEQNEASDDSEAADTNEVGDAADSADGQDADQVQESAYTGSIAVDEASLNGLTPEEECAALTAQATVTPEEAQAAAEAETSGVVVKVALDVENGSLVYGVEMEDGSEVKVDAGNGDILNIEAAEGADAVENEGDAPDAVAPANTGITADEAQAIAEAETGNTTLAVEYDLEGGVELFEVEMADGTDVRVAASDGTILGTEQRDAE